MSLVGWTGVRGDGFRVGSATDQVGETIICYKGRCIRNYVVASGFSR